MSGDGVPEKRRPMDGRWHVQVNPGRRDAARPPQLGALHAQATDGLGHLPRDGGDYEDTDIDLDGG